MKDETHSFSAGKTNREIGIDVPMRWNSLEYHSEHNNFDDPFNMSEERMYEWVADSSIENIIDLARSAFTEMVTSGGDAYHPFRIEYWQGRYIWFLKILRELGYDAHLTTDRDPMDTRKWNIEIRRIIDDYRERNADKIKSLGIDVENCI